MSDTQAEYAELLEQYNTARGDHVALTRQPIDTDAEEAEAYAIVDDLRARLDELRQTAAGEGVPLPPVPTGVESIL